MVVDDFLGHYTCADCEAEQRGMPQPTQKTWRAVGGRIVCKPHFVALMGREPVEERDARTVDAERLPPAETAWLRVAPGLRARRRPAGLELAGVRNVDLGKTVEINDCNFLLQREAIVELVLLDSEYRDADAATKALVRVAIIRILEGKDRP